MPIELDGHVEKDKAIEVSAGVGSNHDIDDLKSSSR
jgi:hypothetical protein